MSNAQSLENTVRPMVRSDLPMVLEWRNHTSVRSYMYSQHEITATEHEKWYESSILNSNHYLLIFEIENESIGFVKFIQLENTKEAGWGFYAAPNAPIGLGRQLGRAALTYGFVKLGLKKINGQALSHNERSIKMHVALGFNQNSPKAEIYFDGAKNHQIIAFSILSDDWIKNNGK